MGPGSPLRSVRDDEVKGNFDPSLSPFILSNPLDIPSQCSIFVPMQAATPLRDAPTLEMLGALTQCAYELGVAAAGRAKNAGDDTALFLALSTEFRDCFFAVRMGIRLSQFGIVAPRGLAVQSEPLERERPEAAERPDPDPDTPPHRADSDRDREGDREAVSLPRFLRSLGLAVTGAEKLQAEFPAHIRDTTLPTLRALLDQTSPRPGDDPPRGGSAVALLARPPVVPASRARLLASAASPPPPVPPARRASG